MDMIRGEIPKVPYRSNAKGPGDSSPCQRDALRYGPLALERRLDKDHEKTTNSAEAWIYRANCQRVLNQLQYNAIQNF